MCGQLGTLHIDCACGTVEKRNVKVTCASMGCWPDIQVHGKRIQRHADFRLASKTYIIVTGVPDCVQGKNRSQVQASWCEILSGLDRQNTM